MNNSENNKRVVAFDLFGTVFDLSTAPREEVRHYIETIQAQPWRPFVWPPAWERLHPFADAAWVQEISDLGFITAALSNAPLRLVTRISKNAHVRWDAIVPLELIQTYKPNPACYEFAATLLGVEPANLLMVSANEKFGDIENSRSVGCVSQLIGGDEVPNLRELCYKLRDGWWSDGSAGQPC